MRLNKLRYVLMSIFGLLFLSPTLHAQDLWGSGAYQGAMSCPYQTQTSNRAVSMSDDEKEAREDITRMKSELKSKQGERKRAENKQDILRRRIERYFDSSVVEFLLDTHIEGNKLCSEYKSARPDCVASAPASGDAAVAPPADCANLTDVPDLLANKWSGPNGYCVGSGRSNAGSVKSSICNDPSLRSSERRSVNVSECSRALSDYRKNRIDLANAADREERLQDEISDKQFAIADAREEARLNRELARNDTEGGCEECDAASRGYSYQKPKRDWTSTIVNVAGGLGLLYYGKQAERAANEYNAQAGWPSTQSYGYPFYQAGISGVINGLVGPGAYGCSGGLSGSGFPYGAGGAWGIGGSANGAYGPGAAIGGAFGYPQNMYGSPWGGGAYNPGIGPNGMINGPNGGFNIGGQFGYPYNGYGNQYGNPQFGINGQFGIGNQYGYNPYNPYGSGQFGLNGQLSAQYQMQMLQYQQQMQQQYYQQQQQYYQQQMQQQMQYQQQAYQRQQQQYQIQMQMAQLNMQLQQLQQQSYYSTGGYYNNGITGGLNIGGSINGSFSIGAPSIGGYVGASGVNPYYPYSGTTGYNPYYPNTYNPGGTLPVGYDPTGTSNRSSGR